MQRNFEAEKVLPAYLLAKYTRRAIAVGLLLFLPSVHANTAVRADASSGTYASQIYWMDWTGLNGTLQAGAGTQSYSFTLADGSTLTLDLTRGGTSTTTIDAVTLPTYSGAAMGNVGYTGFGAAKVALNATAPIGPGSVRTLSFTLSNIVLTNPAGNPVPNFEIVMADAESMDTGDGGTAQIVFTTNGGNWNTLERVPATGRTAVLLTGEGTQVVTQPAGASPVPAWILSTSNLGAGFTVTAEITSRAQQGVMLGIRMGSIRLNKNIVGRSSSSDQFVYRIKNAANVSVGAGSGACAAVGDCTTAGATTGNQIEISAAVANGNSVTLEEAMAPGSVGTLSDYIKTFTCSNTNSGSPTVLPPNGVYDPSNPPQISLQSAADDISCVINNSASADMQAGGTTAQTVYANNPVSLITTCANAGPQAAKNAACVVTGVPAGGTTICSPTSPQASLAVAAVMTCTTTFTPTSAGVVTLTTTASSDTPDPNAGNNTATSTVTVLVGSVSPQPDSATTPMNTPVTTSVITNDTTTTGYPLNPASITPTQPAHGAVVCSAGSCTYTPAAGFVGGDSYTYQVCDTSSPTPACGSTTVTVTVTPAAPASIPTLSESMMLVLVGLVLLFGFAAMRRRGA